MMFTAETRKKITHRRDAEGAEKTFKNSPQRRKGRKEKNLIENPLSSPRTPGSMNSGFQFGMDSRLVAPGFLPSRDSCTSCTSCGNDVVFNIYYSFPCVLCAFAVSFLCFLRALCVSAVRFLCFLCGEFFMFSPRPLRLCGMLYTQLTREPRHDRNDHRIRSALHRP
jgi:hypothetical protein